MDIKKFFFKSYKLPLGSLKIEIEIIETLSKYFSRTRFPNVHSYEQNGDLCISYFNGNDLRKFEKTDVIKKKSFYDIILCDPMINFKIKHYWEVLLFIYVREVFKIYFRIPWYNVLMVKYKKRTFQMPKPEGKFQENMILLLMEKEKN